MLMFLGMFGYDIFQDSGRFATCKFTISIQSTQVPQDPVHSGFQAADGEVEVDGVKGW